MYQYLPPVCWMTEKHLAKAIGVRAVRVKSYKEELENARLIKIVFHRNGRRSNPRHEIIKYYRQRRSPICKHIRESYCLGEWGWLGRNDLLECYLKSGWNIVPFGARAKKPIKGLSIREWARLTAAEKMNFFFDHPNFNVGLVVCSHLMVVDVDSKNNSWIRNEVFANTLTVSTSRGFHFYFRKDPIVKTSAKVVPDIDTRCNASFVLLPGSTHPSGEPYEWAGISVPEPLPIEFRREWRQRDFEARKRSGNFALPNAIEEGTRNDTLWRRGRSLRASGKNYFEIEAELTDLNQRNCVPPLSAAELKTLIDNVYSRADEADFRRAVVI